MNTVKTNQVEKYFLMGLGLVALGSLAYLAMEVLKFIEIISKM